MPRGKQYCPECGVAAMSCQRTCPTTFEGHELESARTSIWRCASCGAEFELLTPAGKLRRMKHGKMSPDLCRRVLRYLGLDAQLPLVSERRKNIHP